jgi:ElaA protein
MEICWIWKRFEDISGTEMHEILFERQNVFVVEQKSAYQDADDLDRQSWHLIGRDLQGIMAAYARITFPGTKYEEPSFGRILTVKSYRTIGLGRQLIRNCIEKCNIEYPGMAIRISAQTYLTNFYKDFGFELFSQPYGDEGIEHIDMVLIPK